jgi:hypothetical protein
MTAHIGPDGRRLPALTIIADTAANAVSGDVVWTGLNAGTVSPTMQPLDASARGMQWNAIHMFGLKPVTRGPSGADSIG